MKIEELEPYLQSLRDCLLINHFIKDEKFFLVENYVRPIVFKRTLEIGIDFGNQYIYVRDSEDNSIVSIYNSDINGNLSIEYLEQLIKTIYWKS